MNSHMKKNNLQAPKIPNTLPDVRNPHLNAPQDYSRMVDYSAGGGGLAHKRLMRKSPKKSQK